ncbi:hypothetical protein RLOC_00011101 [Lonchura striata]|uniref:RRM domain-containing protein n=1 Tax=Lonchura striata TaxID=40157 RepID=A0A218VDN7_9PASE|nr:hypothetical protein RLOC_00011101 [Lonchura striata domestica]
MAAASAVRAAGRRSRRLFDIFVAEVPWTVSSKELKEYFSQFGLVQRCQLPFVSTRASSGPHFVFFSAKRGRAAGCSCG